MTVDRMESTFDLLVNYEFAWNQNTWRAASDETACGTAMCFAGWAVADSVYEPVISNPRKFLAEVDDDTDNDIFTYALIPRDDPLANTPHVISLESLADTCLYGDAYTTFMEKYVSLYRDNFVALDILHLASSLLDVCDTNGNSKGILSPAVFEAGNSLETIRAYIDKARHTAGLPQRDFTSEPVPLVTDAWVPSSAIPQQRARVHRFNERASSPTRIIETDDGR